VGPNRRRSSIRFRRTEPHARAGGLTPLPLTTRELELLLLLLASRPGEFFHRDTIARTLGSPSGAGDVRRGADMHGYRIRRKLRDAGAGALSLDTVYGRGYCLRLEEEAQAGLGATRPQWCA